MIIPRGQTAERRAYMKAWNAANPRDRRAYKKEYDEAHKEENVAYRAANSDRLRAEKRSWYQASRGRVLAKAQIRYGERREQLTAYGRAYYAANADQMKANTARRKARLRGADGSHTLAEWRAKCIQFCHRCAYCGAADKLTRDHVIAVSNGGSDYIENIVPACGPCNSRKRTRSAEDFGRTNHTKVGGIGSTSER